MGARDERPETFGCDVRGALLLGPAESKASSYVGGKSAIDGDVIGGAGSCFTKRRMLSDDDGWSNMCSGMDCCGDGDGARAKVELVGALLFSSPE